MTQNEKVGWHCRFDAHEFEKSLGIGYEQGSLACCSPWGHRVRQHWVIQLNTVNVMIKDTDEELHEEMHRTGFARVLHETASVPVELGCTTLLVCRYIHQPETPQIWYSWGFLEASSPGYDQLLTPFSAPLLSLQNGGSRWKSLKFLLVAGLSGDQPPFKSPPKSYPIWQTIFLSPRNYKGFKISVSRLRWRTKC